MINLKLGVTNIFFRQILQTIFTRFSVQFISIIGSIFIIRELGVFERGQFAFAASVISIGVQFANLGFHSVNTIHLSKKPELLHSILANNALIIFLGSILFCLIFLIVYFMFYSSNIEATESIAISLICVPMGLISLFNQNILIALGKIKEFNMSELLQKLSFLLAAVPAAFIFKTAEAVLFCSFLSFVVTYLYTKKNIFQ